MTSGGRKPPKIAAPGPLRWLRDNLFATPFDAALTIAAALLVFWLASGALQWAVLDAVWTVPEGQGCGDPAGACWPFITHRLGQFIYGFYDLAERWRVDLAFLLLAAGLLWLTLPGLPAKPAVSAVMLTAFPVVAFVLLVGGAGLEHVPTERWGGLLMTLVVAVTGIVASLPLGIMLALGRRSELPVVRWLSIGFIEFWRGVPLITVLFMAANMLPLFMGLTVNKLLAALIAVALFSAAYMAEVVRGGLQAVPRGQYEAAAAMGLGYWRAMGLVVLPQALRLSLPNIVGNFIGLLKDTSLVSIIGFFDLLGIAQAATSDPVWMSPNTAVTGYVFVGVVYWSMCWSMSRYARRLERGLEGRGA